MTVKNIGQRIQKALNDKNLKRIDLAKKIKGSHQKVSSWINGKHSPSLETLEIIMKLTDKDANYFFGYPSASLNGNHNHIVGDNNHNINQTVNNSADIEALKQDVALIKQAILDLQRKK